MLPIQIGKTFNLPTNTKLKNIALTTKKIDYIKDKVPITNFI